jgi:hypothetical protein
VAGAEPAADRTTRLCRLCQHGVGDELHMWAECEEYTTVRRSHAHLFADFGGWAAFPCEGLTADQFRMLMHQPRHQVAAFLHECAQRRWQDPPVDVMFADGLSVEEAARV